MNILCNIAIKELKSNKKMTLMMLIVIIVVTILINSIATLALSYQDYIVNVSRDKENWEVSFDNIQYNNIQILENDQNVKQVAVVQDLGISKNSYSNGFKELIHIKAYDSKALENLNIKLKKGRLPQAENEIIINEDMLFEIGDEIDTVIGEKELTYTIVGKLENTDFDKSNYEDLTKINGAITLCNRENIKAEELVNASIISKDISNIFETANRLENKIHSKNDYTNINIKYNEELLSYACVAEKGSEFQTSIIVSVRFINRDNSDIIDNFDIYYF